MPSPIQIRTSPNASPRSRIVGGLGTQIYSGFIQDYDQNTAVRGDKWYGTPTLLGISRQMMRDAHVRRVVDTVIDPVCGGMWDFKTTGKRPIDLEAAEFCRFAFFECLNWDQIIRRALDYIVDGFRVFEITDDFRPLPPGKFPSIGKQGVVYTGFHDRPAWSIYQFIQSKRDPSKLRGVVQLLPGSDVEPGRTQFIPGSKLLRFTWDQEGADFTGFSPLRGCYGPWKVKILCQILEAMAHERHHIGVPTLTLPEDVAEDEIDKLAETLYDLRANENAYMVLPNGSEFSWQGVEGSSTDIGETIERCNRDISHAFGATFMLGPGSGSSASYALASTQKGQFEISIDKHAKFICGVFNHGSEGWSPIERLVRLNFGEDVEIPKLVARNMPTRDWAKILPMLNSLVANGAVRTDDTLEATVREAMFLPPYNPDEAYTPTRPVSPAADASDDFDDSSDSLDFEITDEEFPDDELDDTGDA